MCASAARAVASAPALTRNHHRNRDTPPPFLSPPLASPPPLPALPALARRPTGRQVGAARLTPHGSLLLAYEWRAPHAGRGEDEFILTSDGRLLVATTNWVGGQEIRYTQCYSRA